MGTDHIDILAVGHAPVLQINRRIYRALARLGWQIEIAIPRCLPWSSDPNIVEPDHPEDPPIHRLEPRGRRLRFWSFEGLTDLLNRKQPRIVYLENGPDSLMAWVIGAWCKRNGAVLISNTYENNISSLGEILRQRRVGAALRSVILYLWGHIARRRVNHVVAICEDGRKAMQLIGFKDAVSVAPLGFDPALFFPDPARRAATRKALGVSQPLIAYFGRLIEAKGVHVLIAALSTLKNQFWQLLIDDFEHDSTEYTGCISQAINEAGICDRVIRFTASHTAMPDYMRAADIVVLPSIVKEQYGRVAPEAMACGCAVIVSDIGALPELVGDTGLKVPPGNIRALSLAIADLLANPDKRAALALRAETRARVELSVERQATLLDSLFRRLEGHPK
jgi:glycosyltransferase involved in cell wall biosynthesis